MIFDPIFLLFIIPPILLMLFAQWRVKNTFGKYSQVMNQRGISGAHAARQILDENGLYDVPVEHVEGELSDHYDPRARALRLSTPVYSGYSVAALGIAAHEAGHALQHAQGYVPLQVRSLLVPAATLGSNLGWIMILGGIFLQITAFAWLGVLFFAAGTLFALVTLPVEFNASSRAMAMLTSNGMIMTQEEQSQNQQVLNAAALTYIAGFLAAFMQLIYWILLVTGMSRD
ncbi:MAG: zinc metallopeptidase [Sphaerobacteraceae bacterium]|nr:MAG: zinc metallopeptidase [Sphaerobacteraceae bacterium]